MKRRYRIFVRDRGRKYSGYCDSEGATAAEAVRNVRGAANLKGMPGMLRAIPWQGAKRTGRAATLAGARWVSENVG